jgi:hypothetical protein
MERRGASRDSSVGMATGYGLEDAGSITSSITASRPALGPTQALIQRVWAVLSPGFKAALFTSKGQTTASVV